MGDDALHELTPGYALNALDPVEEAAYEEHLARCSRCQEELAALAGTASALAFAVEPADPPAGLRGRILDAARAERPNVVPLRPRWASPVGAVAAVAACVAVGLGIWDVSLHNRLNQTEGALRSISLKGATGSVVLGNHGQAALVVANLDAAPMGKTYEAWVINGKDVRRAGVFQATGDTVVVQLDEAVPAGAIVAVTVENAGGADQPTAQPLITSVPA